jgi:hypothetical protein
MGASEFREQKRALLSAQSFSTFSDLVHEKTKGADSSSNMLGEAAGVGEEQPLEIPLSLLPLQGLNAYARENVEASPAADESTSQAVSRTRQRELRAVHRAKVGDPITPEMLKAQAAKVKRAKENGVKTEVIQKHEAAAQKQQEFAGGEIAAKRRESTRVRCTIPALVGKYQVAIKGSEEARDHPTNVIVAAHGLRSIPVMAGEDVRIGCAKGFTASKFVPSSMCSQIDGKFHPALDPALVQCFETPFCRGLSKPELKCF